MNQLFKIGYKQSIKFVFILILFSILTSFLNTLCLYIFNIVKIKCILFPLIYLTPFILFFIFFFLKMKKTNFWDIFYPLKFSNFKIYPLIIIITICSMIITNYLSSIIPSSNYIENMYRKMEKIIYNQLNCPISLIISTTLLAPICEEIFFRGIILQGLLNNKIHPFKAILFSSFLFGFVHMNPWQFIGGIIIGSIFGIIYLYTKSIFNCILLHSLNNLIAIISIIDKNKNEDIILSFIDKNIYIFIITFIIIIICFYALIYQTKKNKKINFM